MTVPTTRFYRVRNKTAWARIWITDDGCFTCLSDYGDYGHWWTHPGCEFRKFLCKVELDYLIGKLSKGKRVRDDEETEKAIRRHICQVRRASYMTKEEAADEWALVGSTDFGDDGDIHHWFEETAITDAHELIMYQAPRQVVAFVNNIWPLFVQQLQAELERESNGN